MNKAQAIHAFWSSFGLPAFDENTVPDKIWDEKTRQMVKLEPPYITYEFVSGSIGDIIPTAISIWDINTSWEYITSKADEICYALKAKGYAELKVDDGYIWLWLGTPNYARWGDDDERVRRIRLNINIEYLTAY